MKTSRSGRRHLINTPLGPPSAGLRGKHGDLKDTRLTWVVGSAIRTATASSPDAVALLLAQLGIPMASEAAITRCPGLGADLVWAFYLERHGWLIATPVASVNLEPQHTDFKPGANRPGSRPKPNRHCRHATVIAVLIKPNASSRRGTPTSARHPALMHCSPAT